MKFTRTTSAHVVPRGRLAGCAEGVPTALSLSGYHDWPSYWKDAQRSLRRCGYATPTLKFYRHVLRAFARHANKAPSAIHHTDVRDYLRSLTGKSGTWHWTAMNISVLRVLFDKLGGRDILDRVPGPRRTRPLPPHLSREDITRLLSGASNLRDQLAVALLYGCGLRTGELQRLRWHDIDPETGILTVARRYRHGIRNIRLPQSLLPILRAGKNKCPAEHYVIPGARSDRPVSARAVQRMITACVNRLPAEQAPTIPVTPMILRHTYAVHFLEDDGTMRELQENLGHETLEATIRYEALVPDQPRQTPTEVIHIDADWETLTNSPFPMLENKQSFTTMLRTHLRAGFLALRRYWNSG